MKAVRLLLMIILAGLAAGSTASGEEKGRKLPVSAYIKSAKIEILSSHSDRYKTAMALLDSLFINYGPHAEGLFLMGQIMVDGIEATTGLKEKSTFLAGMVAYFDSLKMCCRNEGIKKNYRENCDEFIPIADSLKVKYWRQFFNAGLEQWTRAEGLQNDLGTATDSSSRALMEADIRGNLDSCIQNMMLCITAIGDSARPYLIIDKAFGLKGEYRAGIEWLNKGFTVSDDPGTIQLSIAYDFIQMDDYCGAIPYYRDYVKDHPGDAGTLTNLAICYNNCGLYDSALSAYRTILSLEPENSEILANIGLYFNTLAREAADSATFYRQANNEKLVGVWNDKRTQAFDSSRAYFRKAFQFNPADVAVAEQYGVVCAILGDYENAITGFKQAAEQQPQEADYWLSLGDCYVSLKKFEDAVGSYEKVVQLKPDNVAVWEHLLDLYLETGQTAKRAEAEKRLKELQQ
ncbi:MAG TPA: tetratricopeptide repeat protein [Candidatus Deferrimicrobium sp.]|nr:tetratricopeptide repeat protein [Candidatus Deferrimicrobium sp.]